MYTNIDYNRGKSVIKKLDDSENITEYLSEESINHIKQIAEDCDVKQRILMVRTFALQSSMTELEYAIDALVSAIKYKKENPEHGYADDRLEEALLRLDATIDNID